jgi:guanosine-3',5'-bis(diphosphate) 3'-pyrophosphohydrolase
MQMEKLLDRAREFALSSHGAQLYGVHPYEVHLDAVVDLLEPFGIEAQIIGYLHDVIEDTATSANDVKAEFGTFICTCVELLTDAEGQNRKERKEKTYARLAKVDGAETLALIVKTADRLSNVRACRLDENQRLLNVYRDEHSAFRSAAYRANLCENLWAELDALIRKSAATSSFRAMSVASKNNKSNSN